MTEQLQLRGGTAVQNDVFTGAPREVTVDTTNQILRLHDGTTAGGFPIGQGLPPPTPTLQEVTDAGNTTDKGIQVASLNSTGDIATQTDLTAVNIHAVGTSTLGTANITTANVGTLDADYYSLSSLDPLP